MGSFFKPCECRRSSSCPHLYTIRFRNTRGKQAEESDFPTQDAAIERLTELYTARKTTPRSIAEQQEILGEMAFEEYAKAWFARKARSHRQHESRDRVPDAHPRLSGDRLAEDAHLRQLRGRTIHHRHGTQQRRRRDPGTGLPAGEGVSVPAPARIAHAPPRQPGPPFRAVISNVCQRTATVRPDANAPFWATAPACPR